MVGSPFYHRLDTLANTLMIGLVMDLHLAYKSTGKGLRPK
jgi:hypothetical protein